MAMPDSKVTVPPGVSLLHPDSVPERNGVSATWSHVRRKGQWILPRHFRALAIMGGVDLDLTQVVIGPGISEIEAVAFMGSVKILIPKGMRVQVEGDATFGAFGMKEGADGWAPADAPTIVVSGSAYFGGVEIEIYDADESGAIGRFFNRGTK